MPKASRSNNQIPSVGLDIVEIERIARLSRVPRFLKRVFTKEEIRYCSSRKRKWQHFAVRFAAKEAVWKALGQSSIPLTDISIHTTDTGRPEALLKGRPAPHIQVSLSHGDHHALAVALCFPAS